MTNRRYCSGLIDQIRRGRCRKPRRLPNGRCHTSIAPPHSVPLLPVRCEDNPVHPCRDFRIPADGITRFHISKHCCSDGSSIAHPQLTSIDTIISIKKEALSTICFYNVNAKFTTRNRITRCMNVHEHHWCVLLIEHPKFASVGSIV